VPVAGGGSCFRITLAAASASAKNVTVDPRARGQPAGF